MATGILYLIPTIIAADTHFEVIPASVVTALKTTDHFLVENIRTARRFLSSLKIYESIEALSFSLLDKDTPETVLDDLFKPIREGANIGVLSESGCPGIADPGALAVNYAHMHAIKVVPLTGPSSILLALMASGFNGQQFAFHGYLPVKEKELAQKVAALEKESLAKKQTQLFIETPYRNNQLLTNLIRHLNPETKLCVAVDITGKLESIVSKPIKEWRQSQPDLPKTPAIFLFLS